MYQLIKNSTAIYRIRDGASIPNDPANNDYAEVLKWIAAGNTPTPADVPTLAQAKFAQIEKINQAADNAFNAIKAGYPKSEVDTWAIQFDEATALAASSIAKTPTIDGIAAASGVSKSVIATSVLEKAVLFQGLAGQIIGKRKKLTAQINMATTNAAAESIAW